ncbi:RluA family pseudouridine synthase [Leptospira noguchii]|uniref:RNA pseudouridine synthase n=1 Tax=Leptospira noguchii serovar Panama str. CZ214 TaxID=1001595 RepID=T0GVS2_9LEPT|nr:RNA pseudouridine synthase [Leptospira noguchii]EQA73027.1 RNA pseudouridine synthase [Leptospira noguchii serovar Panama str. CZ214]
MEKHSNIKIFYESKSFLFAEKPPGIPVHATKDSKRENFTDQLQKQLSLEYLRTVNRLDLDTSGLVFFCKNPDKNEEANQILKNSLKIYICVTSGQITEKHFTETCYIKDGNKKVRKVFSGGDKAITEFLTLKQNSKENYSVLLAKLHTGRRHQIRFHLSEKGYPILGDCVYGKNNEPNVKELKFVSPVQTKNKILKKNSNEFHIKNSPVKRTLLHAIGFAFQTEEGKEEKIFCPPPADFQEFLEDVILDLSIFSKFSLK